MLHLELPHINVLSKIDIITQYGELGKKRTNLLNLNYLRMLTVSHRFQSRLLHGGAGPFTSSKSTLFLITEICRTKYDYLLNN